MSEIPVASETTKPLAEFEEYRGLLSWVSSVDHKQIGIMYLIVTLFFFIVGGVEALLMRIQLARPNGAFLSPEAYNQIFTMHGTTMIFLVVMPIVDWICELSCTPNDRCTRYGVSPIVWKVFVNSFLIILALSILNTSLVMILADRFLNARFFTPSSGGSAVLWQHLFWGFGHPEVYIMVLPAFGIMSEVIPVFSRKPIFGYTGLLLHQPWQSGCSALGWRRITCLLLAWVTLSMIYSPPPVC